MNLLVTTVTPVDINSGQAHLIKMVNEKTKANLEKQQYEFIGNHSAIKVCEWTKKSIRGQGVCYKEKFYGIKSHQCCQMSVSVGYCQNACVFCWRDLTDSKISFDQAPDDPQELFENSIKAQQHQLVGFYGNENVDFKKLEEAQTPMQYAISLTGDALLYPRLNEFIKILKDNKKTVFIVTNGMAPDTLKNIEPPTQLYISVDAPNMELFKKIDKPMLIDGWERLQKSLENLKEVKTKTTLRLTLIKGMNMEDVKGWAEQIKKAEPYYVEVKAYMFVGSSRQRLTLENMPYHNEVKEFAKLIADESGYEIVDEQDSSRVVLLKPKV